MLKLISRTGSDLEPALQSLVETATRLCQADSGYVFRMEDGRHELIASFGVAPELRAFMYDHAFPSDRGTLSGRAALERRVVHVEDAANDPEHACCEAQLRAGLRTGLGVPLLREDTLLGVLVLHRSRVEPFTDKQIALVTTFADQAAIAIENTRLRNELTSRTEALTRCVDELGASGEILRLIARSPDDVQLVFATIVRSAVQLSGAQRGALYQFDGELIHLVAHHNQGSEALAALQRVYPMRPSRSQASGRAILSRGVAEIRDVRSDPEYLPGMAAQADLGSLLAVPMLRADRTPSGVIVIQRSETGPFAAGHTELLRTFADQAVIAMENARLLRELRDRTDDLARSVEELRVLGEVSQAVGSSLDLDTVLTTTVDRAVTLAEGDAGMIYRYDEASQRFQLRHSTGLSEVEVERIRATTLAVRGTSMGQAIATGEPVQIADFAALPGNPLRDLALAVGFRASLIVPLVGAKRAFGTLVVLRRAPGEFPAATVNLLRNLASQSVLAIQNARLFQDIGEQGRQLAIASQHKSQFLANMSHELRTPLNAILGYTELLIDGIYGDLPEKQRSVLERVQSNGRHLLGLINDVLDLSKIEAGQLKLALEDYAMPTVVQAVVAATESLATNKGLKLKASVTEGMPVGRGDERRVTQVLLNLVGNAIKFTDQGEIEIRAGVAQDRFALAVADTGPGISTEDQARIFEEFQQVDNTSTRRKGGTGLGLAISRRIVEMHGGRLSVESERGKGSTFRVELPVRVEQQQGTT